MRVHATVTIKVVYDDAKSLGEARQQAMKAADHLVQVGVMEGLWSGDTDMLVENATFDVAVHQPRGSGEMRRRASRRGTSRRSR